MSVEVKQITQPLHLGEGPHWDESTKALYFVGIYKATIHKYDPATDTHTFAKVESEVHGNRTISLIIPVEGEPTKFLISYGGDIGTVTWDGVSSTVTDVDILIPVESNPALRINDGKTSPDGILYAGSMAYEDKLPELPEAGSFYSFKGNKPKLLQDKIGIANGLAWSADQKRFYYIDSFKYKVEVYDHDAESATISNGSTLFDFKENNIIGIPDGMTIDTDENLYVACFGASQVLKIDSKTGTLLSTIKFPCSNITSVAFGGPTLEDLYVTSAQFSLDDNVKITPEAGAVFKVTGTGSKGLPGVPIKL